MAGASLQVISLTGKAVKTNGNKVSLASRADTLWFSSDSSGLSTGDYLSFPDDQWITWQRGQSIELKFTADTGGSDGQGFTFPGFCDCEVTGTSGSVYTLDPIYIMTTDTKVVSYANSNHVAVSTGDKIYAQQLLLCGKTGSFTIKLTAKSNLLAVMSLGIIQTLKSDK